MFYMTEYKKFILEHTPHDLTELFVTGVYQILNLENGKRYIGSAAQDENDIMARLGFYVRWYLHKTMLDSREHHCQHLENAWHYYGHDKFEFSIIEFCDSDKCIEREQYYLNLYWDSNTLYNHCRIAGSNAGVERTPEWRKNIGDAKAKTYLFVNPDGEEVEITNLSRFCENNGLTHANMLAVLLGKRNHHKGWTAVGSNYKPRVYEFIAPDGKLYTFGDLNNFCKKHGLCQPAMSQVWLAKTSLKQYKGWYVPGRPPDIRTFRLLSPWGEIIETNSLRDMCREYGLNSGALSQMLKGKLTHHKKWKRVD